MNIRNVISQQVANAMLGANIPATFTPNVAPSKNPAFGDYQANGAMAAAKALNTKPRDLAQKIVEHLALDGIAEKIEIAGPGFINIHLDQHWLAERARDASNDSRLGIEHTETPQTVVVDYSAPNLAKEMHVGHLRSTIIGDAIARVLALLGHRVIRQNHVGDWGTQFGMLVAELEQHMSAGEQAELALNDLESFYQQAKKHFDDDPTFANTARDYVVRLQSGDEAILTLWRKFKDVSLNHNQELYAKLNVTLSLDDVKGESSYNDDLPVLVQELKTRGIAVEDQGAVVVYLDELADKEGNPSVVIIQKNDGGFLYATTDLAAMRYRIRHVRADRLLYFIDNRQSLHMKQVFAIARKAGFVPESVPLEHHPFGTMQGKDKKPFKTRSGGTIKLAALLEEAVERAAEVVRSKNSELSEEEVHSIAEKVGIGAIKYADLVKTRTHDYVFDWDTMLSFEGNTGPYLQYAYTRICSIFRNAEINIDTFDENIVLAASQERALALKLVQLPEIVEHVAEDAYPHTLCGYLYDLASLFMSFYEACPILKPDVESATKLSRLQLCKCTAKTLALGLDVLGINVMKKM